MAYLDDNGLLYLWNKIKTLVTNAVANKVDKVSGKGLSTNDYTTAEKNKLAGLTNFTHPTSDGNKHVPATGTTNSGKALIAGSTAGTFSWQALTKSMVGLGSVDNTSDLNKPISTATQNALDGKFKFSKGEVGDDDLDTLYNQGKFGIYITSSGVENGPVSGHPVTVLVCIANYKSTQLCIDDNKFYIRSRGVSATTWDAWKPVEHFTTEEKTKLSGIAANANNYVHPSTHPATMITQDATHRFVTDTEKNTWNAKASTAVATTTANGLMAAEDKTKLNGIATGATKVIVEQSLVNQSSNPLAGKVVQTMIGNVMDGVTELGNQLDGKVDKVTGKGLSTNDYTTTEKNKLAAFGAASTYALKADIVGMY